MPGGEKKLPVATCPLIKASLGARFDRTCPFFRLADMFVGENTCDGKKKAWEILAEDASVYVMDIPQMKRPADYKHWEYEIHGYLKKCEELTGNKVTPASLRSAIILLNNKRKALQRLANFRKLCNELDERAKKGVSVFPKGTKRILLTGTPLSIPNWKLHHIIETLGGAVHGSDTLRVLHAEQGAHRRHQASSRGVSR